MRDRLFSPDLGPSFFRRTASLVPESVVLIDLSRQKLIRLLESLADGRFSSNYCRHKLAYRLSHRFKLWNTHILNPMIGKRIECRLIGSLGSDRVKRHCGDRSTLL